MGSTGHRVLRLYSASRGQLGTYVGACARLPFVLGIEKLLPAWFGKLHPKYGTPYVSILVLCGGAGRSAYLLSQLGETFRAAYQIMVDMAVITLFIPFLYMFASAWKFGLRLPAASGLFVSGGGHSVLIHSHRRRQERVAV